MLKRVGVPLLAALVACFTGCAGNTAPPPAADKVVSLESGRWYLAPESTAIEAMSGGVDVTLEIDTAAGSVAGMAGCNQYAGSLTVNGEQLSMGPFTLTKKLCPKPEGVMALEQQYITALEGVQRYSRDGDRLTLDAGSGANLVFFREKSETAP